ncbi:unnamed protein product [Lampetra planeri]
MLQATCREMAEVFNPPSNTKRKFQHHKRDEAEASLTYHNTLMVLGQVAYPRLDEVALDSFVMERMLALVHEMGVVLHIVKEEAQSSLWVARRLME